MTGILLKLDQRVNYILGPYESNKLLYWAKSKSEIVVYACVRSLVGSSDNKSNPKTVKITPVLQ